MIRNALDDNLSGFEVVVDNWPKWNCILLRPESSDKVCRQYHESKSNEKVMKYSPSPKREINIHVELRWWLNCRFDRGETPSKKLNEQTSQFLKA